MASVRLIPLLQAAFRQQCGTDSDEEPSDDEEPESCSDSEEDDEQGDADDAASHPANRAACRYCGAPAETADGCCGLCADPAQADSLSSAAGAICQSGPVASNIVDSCVQALGAPIFSSSSADDHAAAPLVDHSYANAGNYSDFVGGTNAETAANYRQHTQAALENRYFELEAAREP